MAIGLGVYNGPAKKEIKEGRSCVGFDDLILNGTLVRPCRFDEIVEQDSFKWRH